ncbi:MAG: hypothetical protein ACP6IU_10275 [Candidatus Asgardarchaeia archaeon]
MNRNSVGAKSRLRNIIYSLTKLIIINDAIEIGEKVIEFLEKRSILTKIPLDIISDLEEIIHEFKERKRGKSNN